MSFGPITLNITVVMGKDLKSMDYIGSSDPWVKLTLGGTVHNTTSKNNTLNPVWNETFKFNGSPNESLTIKVFDKDIITSDEIGGGTVPVTQLVEAAQLGSQLEVSIRNAKGEATGLIYLAVTAEGLHNIYGQSSQAAQQTAQAAAPLIVFLLNAQGLRPTDTIGASSDPWVQLELGGSVQKSKVQNNTTNPVWNEQFQFNAKGNDALNLKVYDKDTFMSDFVGEAAIPVQHLRQAELTGTVITVPLKDAKGTSSGTISIGAGAQAGRFGANPAAQGFGAFGGAGFGAAGLGGAGIGVNPNLAGGFGPGGVAGGFGGPLSGAAGAFGGPLAGGFGANAAFGGQGFGPAGFGPGAQGFGAGQGFGAAGFNQLGGLGVGPGTVGGFGAGVGPGFGAGGFGANAALGGFGAAGFGGAGFGNQAAGIVQLAIKVIGAQGLPAKDTWFTFGNHSGDPWVQLVLGGNTQRTKVVNNTLNPIWNEVFNFSVSSHDTLNIRIYDKDLVLSDFMAEGNVPAQTLLQGAQLGTQFPVQLQNPTGGSGGTIFLATAIVGGAGAGGNFGAGLGGFGAGGFGGAGFGTGFGAGGFGAGGFGQGFGAGFGGLGGLGGFGGAGFGGLGGLGGVDPSLLPPLIRRRIALARLLGVPIDPSILANLGNLGLGNAGDLIPYGGGAGFGGGFGAGFGGNAAALLGGLGGYGGGNIWRQRRNFGGARYLEDFEEPYGAYGGGLEYGYDNLYHGAAPIRQNYSHVEYDDAVAALDAADGVIDGCYFGRRILPQGASIGGGALRGPYPVAGGGRVLRERVLDPYPLY